MPTKNKSRRRDVSSSSDDNSSKRRKKKCRTRKSSSSNSSTDSVKVMKHRKSKRKRYIYVSSSCSTPSPQKHSKRKARRKERKRHHSTTSSSEESEVHVKSQKRRTTNEKRAKPHLKRARSPSSSSSSSSSSSDSIKCITKKSCGKPDIKTEKMMDLKRTVVDLCAVDCRECGTRFATKEWLEIHLIVVHEYGQKQFDDIERENGKVNVQQNVQAEVTKFVVKQEPIENKKVMKQEIKEEIIEPQSQLMSENLQCEFDSVSVRKCTFECKTQLQMDRHWFLSYHNKNIRGTEICCPECSKYFIDVAQHFATNHLINEVFDRIVKVDNDVSRKSVPLECPKCQGQFLNAKTMLEHDLVEHTVNAQLLCRMCSTWHPKNGILFHAQSKHFDCGRMVCPVCRLVARTPQDFVWHLAKHTKLFQCQLCTKEFFDYGASRECYFEHLFQRVGCKACNNVLPYGLLYDDIHMNHCNRKWA